MKNFIHTLLILFSVFCFGQKDMNWYAFYNSDSTKIGYKDAEGNVKIEPKFETYFVEKVFKNVIIVSEKISEKESKNYYINKEGKKFGIDSTYIFDFEYARESEGKIKFRDEKTDKVGFFDKNGKVLIPAVYNDAGDFHNGLAMIMKNGIRKCWKEDNGKQPEYPNCEHWSWEGKTMLINAKNQELFEIPKEYFSNSIDYNDIYKNFKLNGNVDSDIYTTYKGTDGNTYSFYSSEMDFKKWFETKFLPDFKANGKISSKYFDKIIELQRENKSRNISNTIFLNEYSQNINNLIKGYLQNEFEISYSDENIFNEENKELIIDLRFSPKIFKNFYQKVVVFKKIGNSFFITSSP